MSITIPYKPFPLSQAPHNDSQSQFSHLIRWGLRITFVEMFCYFLVLFFWFCGLPQTSNGSTCTTQHYGGITGTSKEDLNLGQIDKISWSFADTWQAISFPSIESSDGSSTTSSYGFISDTPCPSIDLSPSNGYLNSITIWYGQCYGSCGSYANNNFVRYIHKYIFQKCLGAASSNLSWLYGVFYI